MTDDRPLVDPSQGVACLADGDHLVWCVDPNGERWPWVIRQLCPACEAEASHGNYARASHERTGPLPERWRRKVHTYRCGWPRKTDGRPCRVRVEVLGERCHLHAPAAAVELLRREFGGGTASEEDLL